jgi:two-component system, sensor histidine kinase and response regulator
LPDVQPAIAPARSLHCLVAEDNIVNQRLLGVMLGKLGHSLDLASKGLEAVQMARTRRYDAILMDVQMPEMDGFEAASHIRQDEARCGAPHVPVIAVTARAMPGDRDKCLAAGMDAYLSKPFRLQELASVLERVGQGSGHAAPACARVHNDVSSPMESLLDRDEALSRVGGDEELLRELAGLFLDEYPRLLETVGAALQNADFTSGANAAHQLKGLLAQFGADPARRKALELEGAARAALAGDVQRLLTEMRRIMRDLDPDIRSLAQS